LDYAPYRSTFLLHPTKDLRHADPDEFELSAPVFGPQDVDPVEADLTVQHRGEPIGERIVVTGRAGGDLATRRGRAGGLFPWWFWSPVMLNCPYVSCLLGNVTGDLPEVERFTSDI
jgi:hypothetical protein